MPAIAIEGSEQTYLFSVVEADYNNMPDWGGVYIAVNASTYGFKMEDCIAIGSCANFMKWQDKIKAIVQQHKCSHLYLLPEFEAKRRSFAINDIMQTEFFKSASVMPDQDETVVDAKNTSTAKMA